MLRFNFTCKYSRKIKKTRSKNKKVIRIVKKIKNIRIKVLRENEWQIDKDLILK